MKFVVIVLLVLFSLLTLAPNMQGAQYLKVGEMIEHYESDYTPKGLGFASFIDFIKKHYTENVDLSKQEHKNLPFKSYTNTITQLSISEFELKQIVVQRIIVCKEKKYFSEPNSSKNQHLFSIWNPPRI